MPITFTIDTEQRLVLVKPTGVLTTAETLDYFEELGSGGSCPQEAIEVVDFSEVTDFVIRYSNARMIAETSEDLRSQSPLMATIFLCPSKVAFGIARMLQSLNGMSDPPHDVRIARSDEELRHIIDEIRSSKKIET